MAILIKNGRVWDGQQFITADVLTDGKYIAQIAPRIDAKADYTFDATGLIVSPGLVDAHVHMRGISSDTFGIQTEMSCFPFGVTAAADGGAEQGGAALMETFMVKSVAFVCSKILDDRAQPEVVDRLLPLFADRTVGVKVYHSGKNVRTTAPLRQVCDHAHSQGLPVMVHCNGSPVPMAELLDVLAPGDILTHPFHGGNNTAAEDGYAAIKAARRRGVYIDSGYAGHVHTNFAVLRGAIQAGVIPNTISTDITTSSAYKRGGRYGMTTCMTMSRLAGMEEADVFRAVTSAPAAMLGKADQWGSLAPGRVADIAVFAYTDEGFCLTDSAGNCMQTDTGYRCVLTVADGQVVYRH